MTGIPVPQGDYVPAMRHGDLIHTAGMTPRRDGRMMFIGPVPCDAPPDGLRDAVVLACDNALRAALALLAPHERIVQALNMNVFIAAEPGFAAHSAVADHASSHLRAKLGAAGRCARAAVGVATLPGNAPVEITLVLAAGT